MKKNRLRSDCVGGLILYLIYARGRKIFRQNLRFKGIKYQNGINIHQEKINAVKRKKMPFLIYAR